jgi:hypothetical protein
MDIEDINSAVDAAVNPLMAAFEAFKVSMPKSLVD